ncbi:MAG: DUF126 domain-containing protein [Candidatus Brocadiia bacterium]
MSKTFKGRKIVRGKAQGKAIVCPNSFSFLGDVDLDTGEIIASNNPNKGRLLKDAILVFKETKGSSGGSSVLMTLVQKKKAPAALVTVKAPDYNLTEGAILAGIPFVSDLAPKIVSIIKTGDYIEVDADRGIITCPAKQILK